jgi:AraC family transcriptional regulator, positive regulator of tynA and feaB
MGAFARQSWSTADVQPRQALNYWANTVFQSWLEIDSPTRDAFHGELSFEQLGPTTLSIFSSDAQTVRRTWAHVAHRKLSGYYLLQLRAGHVRFEQRGRHTELGPGDSVLIDVSAPYQIDCPTPTRSLCLRFPNEWLQRWLPAPEHVAGHALRSDVGWGTALAAALGCLDSPRRDELALPPDAVAEQVGGLLALAAGADAHATSSAQKLFSRLQQTIRTHCHDPELDPETVARLNGISKRYLHQLCARASTTYGAELMRERLQAASRMMCDRRFENLSVGEIAARSGFLEPSHFSRRFRQVFQVSPTQFRDAQRESRKRLA